MAALAADLRQAAVHCGPRVAEACEVALEAAGVVFLLLRLEGGDAVSVSAGFPGLVGFAVAALAGRAPNIGGARSTHS